MKAAAIPLAGACLVLLFMTAMALMSGNPARFVRRLRQGGRHAVLPLLLWSAVGAVWGVLWLLSAWIAARLGIAAAGT